MQKYQCHKVVEAAVIGGYGMDDDGRLFADVVRDDGGDGYERIIVPNDFCARGRPDLGDYLVRYEATKEQPDGYLSHSPKAVFEAGYAPLVAESALEEAVRAMEFCLAIYDHYEAREFLKGWTEGDTSEWPEFVAGAEAPVT